MKYEFIVKVIESYVEKCRDGATTTSGLQTPPPKFEQIGERPTKDEVEKMARTTAERYGLEISIDEKGKEEIGKAKFSLWDDKHKTVIRLDKMLKTGNGLIDWTNTGQGVYDLDDIFQAYDQLPDIYKDSCEGVEFTNNKGGCYQQSYHPDLGFNSVRMSSLIFYSPERHNINRIFGHEMGHSVDFNYSDEEKRVLKKAFSKNTNGTTHYGNAYKLTEDERRIFERARRKVRNGQYSSNLVGKDKDKGYMSQYVKGVPYSLKYTESFAEMMSAVPFRDRADKSNFHIMSADGKTIDWDTFVNSHPESYQYCCDVVDGKIKP